LQDVEEFVQEAKSGNIRALSTIYERFYIPVYRYLSIRLQNREDVEELTQEVFIKAMAGLPKYESRGKPFVAWLFRIAHNLMIDRSRRIRKMVGDVPFDRIPDAPADENIEQQALSALDLDAVLHTLNQLTNLQRETVSLRFISGLTLNETAVAMGRKENAVKALQYSALQAMRRILDTESLPNGE